MKKLLRNRPSRRNSVHATSTNNQTTGEGDKDKKQEGTTSGKNEKNVKAATEDKVDDDDTYYAKGDSIDEQSIIEMTPDQKKKTEQGNNKTVHNANGVINNNGVIFVSSRINAAEDLKLSTVSTSPGKSVQRVIQRDGVQQAAVIGLQAGVMLTPVETIVTTARPTSAKKKVKRSTAREEKERRTFVTLAYIVTAYVLCWVPFHIIYDMSFIAPNIVPPDAFTYLFWITYVNSTINPFLYAFTSSDTRQVIKKIVICQILRRKY